MAAIPTAAAVFPQFQLEGRKQIPCVVSISIQSTASTNMNKVENLASSKSPSTQPIMTVFLHDGFLFQLTTFHATAKISNVAAPSVVTTEKCAISAGENANNARAKFAAEVEIR